MTVGTKDGVPTIVLFPGLGMDGRTFDPQRALPFPVVSPAMPVGRRGETLEDYSKRVAELVPRVRPLYLGGVSIGGAVALEVSRHVPADGVFLIASAMTSWAIPNLLRGVGKVAPYIPTFVLRPFARRIAPPIVRWLMKGSDPNAGPLLAGAVRDLDIELWKWGAGAIMSWEFRGQPPCPVHHIHGDADPITPVYRVHPDVVVHGGGHMLNVTHPDAVNNFVASRAASTE